MPHFSSQELPILSKLDPQIYGPPESAITKALIEPELNGMKIEEVIISFEVYTTIFFSLQTEVNIEIMYLKNYSYHVLHTRNFNLLSSIFLVMLFRI